MLITYNYVIAATGCLYTSGNIYIKLGGSGGVGVPNYIYSTSADRVSASSYCVVAIGGSNSCYINGTSPAVYGVLVSYTSLPCSMDNEIYLLIIATTALSYYLLKNKELPT